MQGVVLDSLYKLWLLTTTLLKNESLVNACLVTDRQMQNNAWSPQRIGTGGLKNHRFTKFICMRIALWNYIAVNWQHLTSWELERRAMQNRLLYCQSMAYALCKYPACMVGTLTTSLGHMTVWITFFGQTSLFNLIWPTTWIMKTSLLCPWDTYNTPWCDVIWRHGVTSQCGVRWPMSRVPPPPGWRMPPPYEVGLRQGDSWFGETVGGVMTGLQARHTWRGFPGETLVTPSVLRGATVHCIGVVSPGC